MAIHNLVKQIKTEIKYFSSKYSFIEKDFVRSFFRESKFVRNLKSKTRQQLLAGLLILTQATSSLAISNELAKEALELYDRFGKKEVTLEETASSLNVMFQQVSKEVGIAIKNGDFHRAEFFLKFFVLFAEEIGDKQLKKKYKTLAEELHNSLIDHIDLEKSGMYKDGLEDKLYFIGEVPATIFKGEYFKSGLSGSANKSKIRLQALGIAFQTLGIPKSNLNNTAMPSIVIIMKLNEKKKTIAYLLEVNAIIVPSVGDITKMLIDKAPYVPILKKPRSK